MVRDCSGLFEKVAEDSLVSFTVANELGVFTWIASYLLGNEVSCMDIFEMVKQPGAWRDDQ